MGEDLAVKEGSASNNNQIDLSCYPPRLRKLATYMTNTKEFISIPEAVKVLGLNEQSIWNAISESRKKGNDFYALVTSQFRIKLLRHKNDVGSSLVERAVSGSFNHQKLYFQLTGDLKESEKTVNINNLTIGINHSGTRPSDLSDEKGVIDIIPEIPIGK